MIDSNDQSKALIFITLFGALYFLLLVLTESNYSLFVSPFFLLLYALSSFSLFPRKKERSNQWLWIIGAGLTAILSVFLLYIPLALSIPAAIYRWTTLATVGASIFFFLSTPVLEYIQRKQFLNVLIGIHALFLPLNALLLWNGQWQKFIPSNSLLDFMVGQNHVYILYLIALPLCAVNISKSKKPWAWTVLTVAFAAGVLFSFSRVGILLLLIELFYLVFFQLRTLSPGLRKVIFGVVGITASMWLLFVGFTLNPQYSLGTNCKMPVYQDQLCKSFSSDQRTEYLRQAFKAIQQSPFIGSGGYSFAIMSLKFRSTPNAYTEQPHNEYAQLFVEYGILGLVLCLGYAASILYAWEKSSKLSQSTRLLVFIATILAIDSFFNFNWSFPGLFLIEMIIWAIMFRQVLLETAPTVSSQVSLARAILPLTVLGVPLFAVSILFSTAELKYQYSPEKYVEIFPFSSWKVRQAIYSPETSEDTRQQLKQLYRNDVSVMRIFAEQEISPQKRLAALTHLLKLDPMNATYRIQIAVLATQVNNPELLKKQLHWLLAYYDVTERHTIQTVEPSYLDRIITYANTLSETDATSASEITALAYQFEPWRVNDVKTQFLLKPSTYPDENVVAVLNSVDPYILWSYSAPLHEWSWSKVTLAAQSGNWDDTHKYSRVLLLYSDWYPQVLWGYLSNLYTIKLQATEGGGASRAEKQLVIQAWRESLVTIKKFGKVGGTSIDTTGWAEQIEAAIK